MAFYNFWKKNETANEKTEEQRSYTTGGVTVSDWDAAFGTGANIDKLSVVYGCVNLRASTIASLPIQLNRRLDQGHETAKDHPYYNLVTKAPNKFQTNYTFWHWCITQLDLFGNAYIQKIRRGDGSVAELIPLNPNYVQITLDDEGNPLYDMTLARAGESNYNKRFTSDQIIHIKGYSRNGIYGISMIDTFRTLFSGYSELENAGTQIAKNAAKPSGVIYYPQNLKEEELNKLKANWQRGFSGGNSGKTAFLPSTLKSEAMTSGLTAQEAEYISQKQFSAQRIAADIFRVPLHMLGLTNAPTYASVEQQAIEFVQYTLTPIITNVEQQIQKQLLDDSDEFYINFNVAGLLRGDVNTRIAYLKFLRETGAITVNDIHAMEDTRFSVPADKGGDDYIIPANFMKTDADTTSEE